MWCRSSRHNAATQALAIAILLCASQVTLGSPTVGDAVNRGIGGVVGAASGAIAGARAGADSGAAAAAANASTQAEGSRQDSKVDASSLAPDGGPVSQYQAGQPGG